MKWHDPTIRLRNSSMPDGYTARDRANALHILSNAVALRKHPYDRDPASGAGNCWCGRGQRAKLHHVRNRTAFLRPAFNRDLPN